VSGGGGHGHGKKGGRHEEHEEHEEHVNHEAWVIPYADMLTLLMALFLVLFAMGRTDLEKFKKLAESFRSEFGGAGNSQVVSFGEGGTSPLDGGEGVLSASEMPSNGDGDGTGDGTGLATPTELQIEQAVQEAERAEAVEAKDALEAVQEAIRDAAAAEGLGDNIAFKFNGKGLVLSLVNSALLFDSGQSSLKPDGIRVLQTIAPALQQIPNEISIQGHTDDVGSADANYVLSSERANSVRRFLELQGGFDGRIEIGGWGEARPVADNSTPEGRAQNRRVEITIVSDISLAPALEADAEAAAEAAADLDA
jgi:chemotaxis protein MotB